MPFLGYSKDLAYSKNHFNCGIWAEQRIVSVHQSYHSKIRDVVMSAEMAEQAAPRALFATKTLRNRAEPEN